MASSAGRLGSITKRNGRQVGDGSYIFIIISDPAQILNEKKLLDFETFEFCNTYDEEAEEDVEQNINADQIHRNGNRPQELPRPVNKQRNVADIQ